MLMPNQQYQSTTTTLTFCLHGLVFQVSPGLPKVNLWDSCGRCLQAGYWPSCCITTTLKHWRDTISKHWRHH